MKGLPNFNHETGFAYGVLAENKSESVLSLGEDIRTHGVDLSYQYAIDSVRSSFDHHLADPEGYDTTTEEGAVDFIEAFLRQEQIGFQTNRHPMARALTQEHWDPDTGWDTEGLWENLLGPISEDIAQGLDESEYEYEAEDGTAYLIGWLGGAPLIWVVRSEYVTTTRPCSPCVPGAGDLDSATDELDGTLCHCPPPDDVDYSEVGFKVVWKIKPSVEGEIGLVEVFRHEPSE